MSNAASPLAPLQRLLELRLQQAQLALARDQRAAGEKDRIVQQLAQSQREEGIAAAGRISAAWDPATHRASLGFLAVLAQRHRVAHRAQGDARQVVQVAIDGVVAVDRRLAVVDRLLRQDGVAKDAIGARRACREADLQWLLLHAAKQARVKRRGGPA